MEAAIKRVYESEGVQELSIDQIAQLLIFKEAAYQQEDMQNLKRKISNLLNRLLKRDGIKSYFTKVIETKNTRTGKKQVEKRGVWKIRVKKSRDKVIDDGKKDSGPTPLDGLSSAYIGKGGEFAVASELIFRNYNANLVSVDDGIDITAFKDGRQFLIQVKTTTIKEGKIYTSFKPESFERYDEKGVYYIVLIRYFDKNGVVVNQYLIFSTEKIKQLLYDQLINTSGKSYTMKFKQHDGNIFIYNDGRELSVKYHLNNFDLIK